MQGSPQAPESPSLAFQHEVGEQQQPPIKRPRRQCSGGLDLPLELIEIVLTFLTRNDAKNLRCVSKDVEEKVSPTFFRSVVVPFNSELQDMVQRDIGAIQETCHGKGKQPASIDALPFTDQPTLPWLFQTTEKDDDTYRGHGYKVFKGFGRHIRNFGMSFEVTADDLRKPPAKQHLDDHLGYYGDYQWPPADYRRFEQLASLEKTADESHLKDAMAHLVNVRALGLSLNSGLGWPPSSPSQHGTPSIFRGTTRPFLEEEDLAEVLSYGRVAETLPPPLFLAENEDSSDDDLPELPVDADFRGTTSATLWSHLQNVQAATGNNAPAVGLPITEQLRLVFTAQMIDRPFRTAAATAAAQFDQSLRRLGRVQSQRRRINGPAPTRAEQRELMGLLLSRDDRVQGLWRTLVRQALLGLGIAIGAAISSRDWVQQITTNLNHLDANGEVTDFVRTELGAFNVARFTQMAETNAAVPIPAASIGQEDRTLQNSGDLQQTQREWLLEADWAQRAFLQSYMLSIIDNSATFSNVNYFNLACLSSRFLPSLCRSDFWAALPGLKRLSLHVLPDWRHIERLDGGVIDTEAQPSDACNVFFRLVNNFVGKLSNVTSLEFGWERTNDDAVPTPSLVNFLPAPLTELQNMFLPNQEQATIRLPHVRNLTLVNCYTTPETIKALVKNSQCCSLRVLSFHRVSLVARSLIRPLNYRPPPFENAHRASLGLSYRDGSWTVLMNEISPYTVIPGLESDDSDGALGRSLEKIEFRSCSYVMSKASQRAQRGPDPDDGGIWNPFPADLDAQLALVGHGGQMAQRIQAFLTRRRIRAQAAHDETFDGSMGKDVYLGRMVVDLGSKELDSLIHDYGFHADDDEAAMQAREPNEQRTKWTVGDQAAFSGVLVRE